MIWRTDRCPYTWQRVLVTVHYPDTNETFVDVDIFRNDGVFSEFRAYGRSVIAWADMPEPYDKDNPNTECAKWVLRKEHFEDEPEPRYVYGCSGCGHSIKSVHERLNYCPNCGRKMYE